MTAENAARAARFLRCDFYWLATGETLDEAGTPPWPFEAVDRERFERLPERRKGEVEKAVLDAIEAIEARAGNRPSA